MLRPLPRRPAGAAAPPASYTQFYCVLPYTPSRVSPGFPWQMVRIRLRAFASHRTPWQGLQTAPAFLPPHPPHPVSPPHPPLAPPADVHAGLPPRLLWPTPQHRQRHQRPLASLPPPAAAAPPPPAAPVPAHLTHARIPTRRHTSFTPQRPQQRTRPRPRTAQQQRQRPPPRLRPALPGPWPLSQRRPHLTPQPRPRQGQQPRLRDRSAPVALPRRGLRLRPPGRVRRRLRERLRAYPQPQGQRPPQRRRQPAELAAQPPAPQRAGAGPCGRPAAAGAATRGGRGQRG